MIIDEVVRQVNALSGVELVVQHDSASLCSNTNTSKLDSALNSDDLHYRCSLDRLVDARLRRASVDAACSLRMSLLVPTLPPPTTLIVSPGSRMVAESVDASPYGSAVEDQSQGHADRFGVIVAQRLSSKASMTAAVEPVHASGSSTVPRRSCLDPVRRIRRRPRGT